MFWSKKQVPGARDVRALPAATRGRPSARWHRRVVLAATVLAVPLAMAAQASPAQASPALAGTPKVTITCASASNCTANGTGFTPSRQVQVQATAGGAVFSSSTLLASDPTQECVEGLKPHCFQIGGGAFTAPLPVDYGLACNVTAAGTVQYTDVTRGIAVTQPVTWTGPCTAPTTMTLSIPTTVDTGWSAINPARVTADSTAVTSGTITITVNGAPACSFTAGAASGCTLANLPAGTDQVQAAYSGSAIPLYGPSSASVTVTVLQVQQPLWTSSSANWAGYADVNDTYTGVSATWTVPAADCSVGIATTSAAWVGIDGATNNNAVEQIGTDSNCILLNGSYWAWFQMYPDPPVVIGAVPANYPVAAGNVMNASVTATGTPGTYTLTIQNQTWGWTYSTTQSSSSAAGASAECIVERPAAVGLPLADFRSVTFDHCEVTGGNGVAAPIWDHPYEVRNMVSGGTPLAMVSPLSDDGTQFTATWQNGS